MEEFNNIEVIKNRFLNVYDIDENKELFINVDIIRAIEKVDDIEEIYAIYFIDPKIAKLVFKPIR